MAKELMEELKSIGENEIVVNKKYVTVDDNHTKLDIATDNSIGLVKTGYTQSDRNYPLKVDSEGNAYTNVPWEDTVYNLNEVSDGDIYTESSRKSSGNLFIVTLNKPYPGLDSIIYVKFILDYIPNSSMRLCFKFSDSAGVKSCYSTTGSFYMLTNGLSVYKLYCFVIEGTSYDTKITVSKITDVPTFINEMTGADGTNAGSTGLVPAPPADADKKYLRGDATWQSIADFSVATATASSEGILKLGSDVVQTTSANNPTSTSGRTYPIQLNSNSQAVVNVPWESGGTYKLPLATESVRGGVQVGFKTDDTNREYAVELDSKEKAYVTIPWTDTTYNAATSSALGLIKTGFVQSNKNYPVSLNSSNQAYVNVPWTDTVYTLPVATTDTLGGIKISDKRNASLTFNYGGTVSDRYYGVEIDGAYKAFVNVPWTDTVYTLPVATSGALGGIKTGYSETGDNYALKLSAERAYVTVPCLKRSGGTMTGVLTIAPNIYEDSYSSGALNANNSNIININSIYTADSTNNFAEGIHFYRDATHVDTFTLANGNMYFYPNRTLGGSQALSTGNIVLHSGNSNVNTRTNAVTINNASINIPSKTSDLTNDSNFVTDSSYVHTDNNYTTAEKTKLSNISSESFVFTFSDGTTATYNLCLTLNS